MAFEKNTSAKKEIDEIALMIKEDDKYSAIECKIIDYFKTNYSNYFDSFIKDIEYLKDLRNNCAHLKVNGEALFVPSDYQIRMLICSMYDHIFSVKAPFITKLFSFVEKEVEDYSINNIVSSNSLDEYIERIQQNYLERMTEDSLKNSYEDFLKLTFVAINDDTNKNLGGLYIFVLAFTDFIIKRSFTNIFYDSKIKNVVKKIKIDGTFGNRANYLIELISKYDFFLICCVQIILLFLMKSPINAKNHQNLWKNISRQFLLVKEFRHLIHLKKITMFLSFIILILFIII